jgi:Protein of unknown function (DUF4246)
MAKSSSASVNIFLFFLISFFDYFLLRQSLTFLISRVAPFDLKDAQKPGHRKMLVFFLCDPTKNILSTARVPPQQPHWQEETDELLLDQCAQSLPPELMERLRARLREPVSLGEAKKHRAMLMDERSGANFPECFSDPLRNYVSFCEH